MGGTSARANGIICYRVMTPLVSFIIPAFNYGRYLNEALDSIAHQSLAVDYEIIVVDDASTDETPEVVRALRHELAITQDHQPRGPGSIRQSQADIRADAGRLAGGDGNRRRR